MSEIVDLADEREVAITRARGVLRAGELVVVPTDTVYGIRRHDDELAGAEHAARA